PSSPDLSSTVQTPPVRAGDGDYGNDRIEKGGAARRRCASAARHFERRRGLCELWVHADRGLAEPGPRGATGDDADSAPRLCAADDAEIGNAQGRPRRDRASGRPRDRALYV